ncbi:hypothetical protein BHM03_00043543 [Ensete ventricosum]|nr:hypothetical protein BHM03_00043543 [Ensete ventricosum]
MVTPRDSTKGRPHERALQSGGEGIDGAVVEGARWRRLQGGRRAYSVRLHGALPPPISTTPSDLSLCLSNPNSSRLLLYYFCCDCSLTSFPRTK